jgi:hypothetical protein
MRCRIIMRCRPDHNFHLCLYPVLPPCAFSIKYNGFNDIGSRRQQPLSAWRLPLNRNDRGSVVLAVRRDFRVWPLLCRDIDLGKLKIPTGYVFGCLRRSSMGSEGFKNVRLCATNSVRTNFKNEHFPVVWSRVIYRARLFLPDESDARYPTFS